MKENKPADSDGRDLRGFARLTPEQRRLFGSKGGRIAHARGTANEFTPEEASRAGQIPHQRGTAHQWTSDEAKEAGRKGGVASRMKRGSTTNAKAEAEED